MLLNVHVKNLALIEDVDIYFGEGLNILTGETGAGKSIIIGSINIALGGKVPKDIIRKNAEYGLVELVFAIEDELIKEKLVMLGIEPDDENQVIITRKITNGRSVIKINGETVTSALLKETSSLLLDVHGQHDHESLLHKNKHLELLDSFIGEEGNVLKQRVKELYNEYKKLCDSLSDFDISEEVRKREMDFLEFEINEIDSAALNEGEDELLEEEQKSFSNAAKILEILQYVNQAMYQSDAAAASLISSSARELSKISDINEKTRSLYNCIMDLDSICQDFNGELSGYIDNIAFDEERTDFVYKRLDIINKLKIKHGNSIGEIISKRDEFAKKLDEYLHYEELLATLNKRIEEAQNIYMSEAKKLSKFRKKAAKKLSEDIVRVLETLNFNSVKFDVLFTENEKYSAKGIDDAVFMISTNPGEDLKPLSDIASGGELSRIMLGIKTILANVDNIETLIFDEIDTGISGRTAQMVAEKMKIIADKHQVICITHLPQIAAMADDHYLIVKNTVDNSTKTEIKKLDFEEAVTELSRMLGGAVITDAVLENAREMKKMATETK